MSGHRNAVRACAALLCTTAPIPLVSPACAAPAAADAGDSAHDDEVVVNGKATYPASAIGSVEQALEKQKDAPNIIAVLPQSEIKQLPNFVLGDAARHLPGASIINKSGEARSIQIRGIDPNLNGVTFEGVLLPAGSINAAGRAVPLDAIPAALAGGLELIKTNAPSQEATALGGQLNIVSRDIGPDDKPFLEIIGGGGFRSPHALGLYEGTISGGFRFGLHGSPFSTQSGEDRPFSLSFFATDLGDRLNLDNIQQTFADKSTLPSNTLTAAQRIEYVQSKQRRGYGGAFSWDVDANNRLYIKGFASGIDYHPVKYPLGYAFSNPVFDAAHPGVYTATAKFTESMNDNLVHDDERLVKFGGVSTVGRITLDYYGAYASNRLYSPYSYTGTLTNPNTAQVVIDNVTSSQQPSYTPAGGINVLDYSAYRLSALSNFSQDDRDGAWSGHIGLSAPVDLGPVKGVLSAGGGLRRERVTHDDLTYTYAGFPALTGAQLGGSSHYVIFDGAYDLGTPLSAEAIRKLINSGTLTRNVAANAITNQQAALDDNENIYNGYVQYSASWNRLGVLAGLRYEKTDGIYRGTATSVVSGVTTLTPRTVRAHYDNLFPTVQLRYAVRDNLVARANWSTAIGRPGFSQITATQTVNYSTGVITQGNPDLKPTTGDNYDLSLEYYPAQGGILSIGGFDKEFSNYVTATTTTGSFAGIAGTATFTTYANIAHASARGFEVNYRQQMTFLPGLWSGIGLGANFTYVRSRGAARAGAVETLPNTTPRIVNVEAFYRHAGVSLQLMANYQSRTMTALGLTPAQDTYVQPFLNFDFDARVAITRQLSVFAQGRNVTREKQVITDGPSKDRYTEIQYFGSSYLFGFDLKL